MYIIKALRNRYVLYLINEVSSMKSILPKTLTIEFSLKYLI